MGLRWGLTLDQYVSWTIPCQVIEMQWQKCAKQSCEGGIWVVEVTEQLYFCDDDCKPRQLLDANSDVKGAEDASP